MTKYVFFIILLITTFACSAMAEDVIIVNRNNPINEISSSQLKMIYNGTIKLWENGSKIIPVDIIDDNPSASYFAKHILHVDLETKRRFWIQKIYAGIGSPPRQEKDFAKVVAFVASVPGAIGYVNQDYVTSAVKPISINGQHHY